VVVPVCHSGHAVVRHSSRVLRRSSLSRALLIALLGGLCLAPGAIADNTAPKPDLPPPAAEPIASSVPVGREGGNTDAPALPSGVSSSGLTAGAGSVDIREYVDMSSAACGKSHQRIVPTLLRQVAAEGLGSVSLRPLITSRDMNSTEAGTAIIAAGLQDKAWEVTGALFRARGAGGDWVNPTVLRTIATGIGGLRVTKFLRDAGGIDMYPQLSAIKQEARAAGITVTPAFVVRGPSGSKVVSRPSDASQVIAAIKSVQ